MEKDSLTVIMNAKEINQEVKEASYQLGIDSNCHDIDSIKRAAVEFSLTCRNKSNPSDEKRIAIVKPETIVLPSKSTTSGMAMAGTATNGNDKRPCSSKSIVLSGSLKRKINDIPLFIDSDKKGRIITNRTLVNSLNPGQQAVYEILSREIQSTVDTQNKSVNSFIALLDAPPGTGKSYLVQVLLTNTKLRNTVLVYAKRLVTQYIDSSVSAETVFKFLAGAHGVPMCEESIEIVNRLYSDEETLEGMLYKLYNNISILIGAQYQLLVVDEYTVLSPHFILALSVVSLYCRSAILFIGDWGQLGAIQKSLYHPQTNRTIIELFARNTLSLVQQMRVVDKKLISVLETLKNYSSRMTVQQLGFHILFMLFENFVEKFFCDDYDALYIAAHHKELRARQAAILAEWQNEGHEIVWSRYQFTDLSGQRYDFGGTHSKFITQTPLVVGKKYLLSNTIMVTLIHINKEYLRVKLANGTEFTINRIEMSNETPYELRQYLKEKITEYNCDKVFHFRLKLPLITYHAIQGTTLKDVDIVLNVANASHNGVYVGASRVRTGKQIHGIHTPHLYSLMYTALQNDEYFYIIRRQTPKWQHAILEFFTENRERPMPEHVALSSIQVVTTVAAFERSGSSVKIRRCDYKREVEVAPETALLTLGEFFKQNLDIFNEKLSRAALLERYEEFKRMRLLERMENELRNDNPLAGFSYEQTLNGPGARVQPLPLHDGEVPLIGVDDIHLDNRTVKQKPIVCTHADEPDEEEELLGEINYDELD